MALRPPSPLGTVLEPFGTYGSSRDKALREQDRFPTTIVVGPSRYRLAAF